MAKRVTNTGYREPSPADERLSRHGLTALENGQLIRKSFEYRAIRFDTEQLAHLTTLLRLAV